MAETLATLNKKRWDACKIPANKGPAFKAVADKILANKARYVAVEKTTGVPWWFIAVTHYRESSLNFSTFLGNGQPLTKKTTIVPKGRGPFATWEEGAVDALVNCAPFAAKNKNWSLENSLVVLEKYNGLGYANKGVPSPYMWAGTDQYKSGKYVADHVYDPKHVDKQLGVVGILKFLGVFNKTSSIPAGAKKTGILAAIAAFLGSAWQFGADHWGIFLTLGILGLVGWTVYGYLQHIKEQTNG